MLNQFIRFYVVLGLLFLCSFAVAFPLAKGLTQITTVEGITEYRLSNGLKVILMPDAAKPTVTVNVTYLVGSRFENYGETGMAHLLEHMMFKGTPKIPKIDIEFNQRGMRSNASTSLDRTNFYEQFESKEDNLRWAIRMEADRMTHSTIAKKDLDSEMTVVRNEYEMGENSAESVMLKRMQSVAYDWHNYGNATIGNRSDIENVNIQHLQAFYHLYYQPDNAVLVVAGKFDVAKVLNWIAADFGVIPKPTRHLPVFWTVEPTQDGERQFIVRRKGDTQLVMVGYKIPAALHPDSDALSFASDILSDNPTGRLYKALVDSGKAVDVFTTTEGSVDPSLMVIGAIVKKGDPVEPVRDALVDAIENFYKTPPTPDELERMKRNYRNQSEKIASDPETLSLELSEDIALGDWRYFFLSRDNAEQMTAARITEAAQRYLRRDNRVVGLYIPDSDTQRAEIPAAPDIQKVMQNFHPDATTHEAEIFDPSPENIESRLVKTTIGGLNVAMLSKKNKSETVSVVLDLHWGDAQSLFGKKMISLLTDAMLSRGTAEYSRDQLNDEFAQLKISGEPFRFETTRENLSAALILIGKILKRPTFPENEFTQLKKQAAASLEAQAGDPSAVTLQAMRQHFNHYPPDDWRYSESVPESIARIDKSRIEDLKSFYTQFYGASHGELTIVGDVDVDATKKVIGQVFGDWVSPAPYARIDESYSDIEAAHININTPDKENGFYLARQNLNLNDDDPQYPALVIANYIFGGGAELDSILMQRLRQADGVSYDGGSSLHVDAQDNASYFQIDAIAAPQNLAKVGSAVQEELARILKNGFSADEVKRAQSGFIQQALQERTSDSQLAEDLNKDQFLNRSMQWTKNFEDKIRALTPDDVNAAFRAWIHPERMTIIIAGDKAKTLGRRVGTEQSGK